MKKRERLTVILGILIILTVGFFADGCVKKPKGPVADLLALDGAALIRKQGTEEWVPLADGAKIGVGDEIITKEDGTVEIEVPVENFIKIGANTHVKISDIGMVEATKLTTNRLELVFGRIRSVVSPFVNKESSFIIEMGNAYVGVRGTDFGFIREPEGARTTVLCLDGSVTVESLEEKAQGLKPAVLDADTMIALVAGEAPAGPERLDEGLKREFIREMDFTSERARERVREDLRYTKGGGVAAGTYTVAPGDSLWTIARDRYGEGERYPTIVTENADVIMDPDLIYPGTTIRVPGE